MSKRLENIKKNFVRNMGLLLLYAVIFYITSLTSAHTLNAQPVGTPQTTFPPPPQTTTTPPQTTTTFPPPPPQTTTTPTPTPPPQTPIEQQEQDRLQQNQQPLQISWDELEEAESFIADGNMDSTLYTSNGNWRSIGNWSMNVDGGELTNFTATMAWSNGTAAHTHEFLNFEPADDVVISADDQTISVTGTTAVGTNGAVSWEEVPSEIAIEGGRIIAVSVDNEATDQHFSGQSVYGNLTSLEICSTAAAPGPAMQVPTAC
jgi:hypothetical protein